MNPELQKKVDMHMVMQHGMTSSKKWIEITPDNFIRPYSNPIDMTLMKFVMVMISEKAARVAIFTATDHMEIVL